MAQFSDAGESNEGFGSGLVVAVTLGSCSRGFVSLGGALSGVGSLDATMGGRSSLDLFSFGGAAAGAGLCGLEETDSPSCGLVSVARRYLTAPRSGWQQQARQLLAPLG